MTSTFVLNCFSKSGRRYSSRPESCVLVVVARISRSGVLDRTVGLVVATGAAAAAVAVGFSAAGAWVAVATAAVVAAVGVAAGVHPAVMLLRKMTRTKIGQNSLFDIHPPS